MGRSAIFHLVFLLFSLVKMGNGSPVDTTGKRLTYDQGYYLLTSDQPLKAGLQGVTFNLDKANKTYYVRAGSANSMMGTAIKLVKVVANSAKAGPDYNEFVYVQMGKQGLYWGLRRQGGEYALVLTGASRRSKFEIVPSNACPAVFYLCGYDSIRTCSPTNTYCVNIDFHTINGVNYFKIYEHNSPSTPRGGVRIDFKPL